MIGEELNILSKIKVRSVEEQRDYLLEQNMLLTEKIADLEKENLERKKRNGELAGQKASLERWFGEAKEIICEYVRLANLEKEDTVAIWQLYHKAEQFLSTKGVNYV